ncbi:MAG: GMC family oxidoreductase [Deltaproteobacteria bacterium]|nr:MAG: GMC family oxidoreductase [Deltaproteobacteria bacterium]
MTLRDHTDALGDTSLTADVIIVGSGPGGASVARVLAEGGVKVLMLEEGPARPKFRPNFANAQRYHMQENGAIVAQGLGSFVPVAAGRGVGGGTLVNSAMCWRTPDYVLEKWTKLLGVDHFSPTAMGPIFDEIEEIIQVVDTPEAIAGENNKLIVRGATKLGLETGFIRRNTPTCVGCCMCMMGCPSGGKASVDRNLVPMAREHGTVVQGDVKVEGILVEDDRVVGVRGTVYHPDTREVVGHLEARAHAVILSAGAIGTPRLLALDGLASRLGPAVGTGLHLHPGSAVVGICEHEVNMWRGATQAAYFKDKALPGVLPHTIASEPGHILMIFNKVGHEAKALMPKLPYMCGIGVMISDKSQGTVGARSDGRSKVTYHWDEGDVERLKAGMVRSAEVLMAGGAVEIASPVGGMGTYTDLDRYAADLATRPIRDFGLYSAHPMATCRMGTDPATSVIDPYGKAHAIDGLYIADASVFPTSLGVNPQLTTMAIATALARQMLAKGLPEAAPIR